MSQYFKGQGLLTLSLDTGLSLASASNLKILYTKPDGTKSSWVATANGTKVEKNLSNTDIDQAGTWQLQSYIEISGEKGYGVIESIEFKNSLS
jgi:hypothetical protein